MRGFGLIQVPRYQVAAELESKQLVPVLDDFPAPSHAPHRPPEQKKRPRRDEQAGARKSLTKTLRSSGCRGPRSASKLGATDRCAEAS